jgi:DtxR family Mn-dependent transcriptional regulator
MLHKKLHSVSPFHSPIGQEQNKMSKRTQLSASLEDYIEAIYNIVAEKQKARSKDIAASLNVSGASVTEALRSLAKKKLINYAPYEAITLTSKGRKAAEDVVHRHNALKQFFIDVLDIKHDIAEQGACRVEHTAPQEIIDQMIRFINYLETCPSDSKQLVENFKTFSHTV